MKLIKCIFVLSIFLACKTSLSVEIEELPTVTPISFEKIEIIRENHNHESDRHKIFGTITYANECKVLDQKFKKVTFEDSIIQYNIYGTNYTDSKLCPQVFIPVTKTVLIDTIILPKNREFQIKVNKLVVN